MKISKWTIDKLILDVIRNSNATEEEKQRLRSEILETAIKTYPNYAGYYYEFGCVLDDQGFTKKAQKNFQKAFLLDPKNQVFWNKINFDKTPSSIIKKALSSLGSDFLKKNIDDKITILRLIFQSKKNLELSQKALSFFKIEISDKELFTKSQVEISLQEQPFKISIPNDFDNNPLFWRRIIIIDDTFYKFRSELKNLNFKKSFTLELEDGIEDDVGVVCFSTPENCKSNILMPDPDFFNTNAYEDFSKSIQNIKIEKDQISHKIYFRGALTGYLRNIQTKERILEYSQESVDFDILNLPRAEFCLYANDNDFCDAKVTKVNQYLRLQEVKDCLKKNKILGKVRPNEDNLKFKYQMDIDGNSNAWAGLFTKLLSKRVTFRYITKPKFQQWFYKDLSHLKNIVHIIDLDELESVYKMIRDNDNLANKIASAGYELAKSLRPRNEFKKFLEDLSRRLT